MDLWDFANKLYDPVTLPHIKAVALNLKNAVVAFVTEEHHSSNMVGSHGIAIYFPPGQTEFNNDPDHTGYDDGKTFIPVDFVKNHTWNNWLKDNYPNIP